MPVMPVAVNDDGTVDVAHGDHAGTVAPTVTRGWSGTLVSLACPTCGAESAWPTGGGAGGDHAALLAEIAAAHP